MLCEITVAAVGQDNNDIAAGAAFNQLFRRRKRRSRRGTGKNPFLFGKLARTVKGFSVVHLDNSVDKGHIHRICDEVVSDALNIVVAVFAAAHCPPLPAPATR